MAHFIEINDWQIALIERRLAAAEAGGESAARESRAVARLKGTDNALPMPDSGS